MNTPVVRILFVLIATAAAVFSLAQGDSWYLILLAAAVFILAAFIKQGSDDNRIFILATGELLVIAVAAASFWAGSVVQCAVLGTVLLDGRVPVEPQDLTLFALCCIATLSCAIIFDRSNQVLLPFLVLTALVAATTVILVGVQEIRERRIYAGEK